MASPAFGVTILSPDRLQRSVWVVVDPRDAVTGERLGAPLHVRLRDVTAVPIAGRSGVYCFTDLALPAGPHVIQVEPLGRNRDRYLAAEAPFGLVQVPVPGQSLQRNPVIVDLLPRPAYPFGDRATLARGRLVKASDGTGLPDARILLILEGNDEGLRGRTDERGAFVTFFPAAPPEDVAAAGLKDFTFQLRFEIDGQPPLLIAPQIVREGQTATLADTVFPGI